MKIGILGTGLAAQAVGGKLLDLGDITTARGTEMLLPVWLRLIAAMQNPTINFHIAVGLKTHP